MDELRRIAPLFGTAIDAVAWSGAAGAVVAVLRRVPELIGYWVDCICVG